MNIWLINPYGPIPGEGWREYRYTMIGEALSMRGHNVIWWTANFSHHFKQFRSSGWCDIKTNPRFTIRLVPTSTYKKNISVSRILFELRYAIRLWRASAGLPAPNLILAVNPPQSTTFMAARLALSRKTKLIVDMFDLWPELFLLAVPPVLRPIGRRVFTPLYMLRRTSLRRADGVIAVCNDYLDKAKAAAAMAAFPPSGVFFIGVDVAKFRRDRMPLAQAKAFARKVGKPDGELWAIYAGTLGNNYDVETLLSTSVLLARRKVPVKIVIAGTGPLLKRVKDFDASNSNCNLKYIGTLPPQELEKYYQICDIGLSPYVGESTVAMPTKIYDYLAAGIPIINSLSGEVDRLVRERELGRHYMAGDAESLFSVISELADDRSKIAKMAARSHATGAEFDKAVQYGRMAEFVEQIGAEVLIKPMS